MRAERNWKVLNLRQMSLQASSITRVIKHHSKKQTFTDKAPIGDSERFSTVARSSSTDAEMGAVPLLSGFISTRIFRSISSSLSLSELE